MNAKLPTIAFDPAEHGDDLVNNLRNRLAFHNKEFKANDNLDGIVSERDMNLLESVVQHRAQKLLESLLIDTENDHNTQDTAKRMAKMYLREIFRGRYEEPPRMTAFPNAKALDEMYVTPPITVRSFCSHHMLPIIGRAWIGVVPGEKVLGLSKFNRIVQFFASRPQIQEELVVQIADFIQETIEPKGLAVLIRASHFCMVCRGVHEPQGDMSTSVLRGVIKDKPEARAEFMSLVEL